MFSTACIFSLFNDSQEGVGKVFKVEVKDNVAKPIKAGSGNCIATSFCSPTTPIIDMFAV